MIAIHPICPVHHYVCEHPQLCDGFCDFTGEPVEAAAEEAEPEENLPWSWIDDLRFLFACALVGFAFAFSWAFGFFISTF